MLTKKVVLVTLCRPETISGSEADLCALSADELSRASAFQSQRLRQRFVCGRLMLRSVIGGSLDIEPQRVPLRKNRAGKLFIQGSELQVSVSYSAGLVGMALAAQKWLGLDLEHLGRRFDVNRLAARALRPEEWAAMTDLSTDERRLSFLRIWVQKEAVAKAMGAGLRYPFEKLEPEAIAEKLGCAVHLFEVGGEFIGCLVAPESAAEVRVVTWLGPGRSIDLATLSLSRSRCVWQLPLW